MLFSYFSSSDKIPIPPPPPYQVFISFRGAELRHGFLKLLVNSLKEEQVNVYIDENEIRGEDLTIIFDRIVESRIAVAIFSEEYTSSKWCLNELVKIKECMQEGHLRVIPIFFNLDTEDVKDLSGKFGDNFWISKGKNDKEPKITQWEDALMSVSRKIGLSSKDIRCGRRFLSILYFCDRWTRGFLSIIFPSLYERSFAKLITEEVKKMLTEISKKEEEERTRQTREREQLAEARRNSLSGKVKELINSVVPGGFLVLLVTLAPYLLGLIAVIYIIVRVRCLITNRN